MTDSSDRPSGPSMAAGRESGYPNLANVVWYRVCVAWVSALYASGVCMSGLVVGPLVMGPVSLIVGEPSFSWPPSAWWGLVAGALAAAPSLVIAIGIGLHKRWAAWLAVAWDAIAVVFCVAFSVRYQALFGHYPIPDAIIACLLAGLEGVYILRRIWDAKRAVRAFVSVALLSLVLGVGVGNARVHNLQSMYEPMISYANSHWITIPKNIRLLGIYPDSRECQFEFRFERRARRGLTCDASLSLFARRTPDGGYRFRGTDPSENCGVALAFDNLIPYDLRKESANTKGAMALLRSLGVRDPNLRFTETYSEAVGYGLHIPHYLFHSPKSGASYDVTSDAGVSITACPAKTRPETATPNPSPSGS